MKIDKIEQHAVIKYLHEEGLIAEQIHEEMELSLNVVERILKMIFAMDSVQRQRPKKT